MVQGVLEVVEVQVVLEVQKALDLQVVREVQQWEGKT